MSESLDEQIKRWQFGGPVSNERLREIRIDNESSYDNGARLDECPRVIRELLAEIEHLKRQLVISINRGADIGEWAERMEAQIERMRGGHAGA